ncbi:hypothetical protein POM88_020413 [Heracleum sosnowskyi]|uniref:F-box associated beta-propeller type 3 domain-containing protein n=1 Tax=Heracleum sosnowskyi TaxID=360622 RepID=A0AAD8IE20_9APIA|nr:hypothetical protein POM88_020413 [Heracleum sosnowskyi]
MISDPEFLENHLANSHKKEAHVLKFVGTFNNVFHVDTRNDGSLTLPLPPQFCGVRYSVVSCNGLVCLSTRRTGDSLYLWNPLMKRFKELPVPNIQAHCALDVGFCFDSVSNDYKVLRIVLSDVTSAIEAELYSTNANSWREIQLPATVEKVLLPWPYAKCVNTKAGVLYLEKRKELLSFDSRNEAFGVHPFPNFMHHKKMSGVLDFNGSAAMIIQSVSDVSVLSLWTLDNVCGMVSWVKKFNLDVVPGISWIALHLGCGQFVSRYGRLFDAVYCFHDYKRKKIIQLTLPPRNRAVVSVFKFTGSLVSLEGFERLD